MNALKEQARAEFFRNFEEWPDYLDAKAIADHLKGMLVAVESRIEEIEALQLESSDPEVTEAYQQILGTINDVRKRILRIVDVTKYLAHLDEADQMVTLLGMYDAVELSNWWTLGGMWTEVKEHQEQLQQSHQPKGEKKKRLDDLDPQALKKELERHQFHYEKKEAALKHMAKDLKRRGFEGNKGRPLSPKTIKRYLNGQK